MSQPLLQTKNAIVLSQKQHSTMQYWENLQLLNWIQELKLLAMIRLNQEIAKEIYKNGAQVLCVIAVYEEKIKEGKLVRKVILVAEGKNKVILSWKYLLYNTK